MKILAACFFTLFMLTLSSCNVMLNLSEPFIPEKLDAKIALLEKIQAEPDSLFVYIGNSEFYDEDYSNDIDTNERFYTMVLESIREKQNSTYYLESIGPKLMDGGDYGALMSHNVMLIHTNTCYGLRLSFVRKYFKWHILTVSHVIPERICMPRISN